MNIKKQILIKLKRMESIFPELNFKYKVNFNLKSNTSMGEYSMNNDILYFNMNICKKTGFKIYEDIVIHEFAHLIINYKYGKNVLVHGKEWKNIMRLLNAKNISATVDFNKYIETNIKVICSCKEHFISKNRFTRLKNGQKYKCNSCKDYLKII